MRKTFLVILAVQFVLMGLFLVFALVQSTQAIKQREFAIQAQQQAEENEKRR
jgi:hypothetical protein